MGTLSAARRSSPLIPLAVGLVALLLVLSSGIPSTEAPASPPSPGGPHTNGRVLLPLVDRSNYTIPDSPTNASSYVQVSQPPLLPGTPPVTVTLFNGSEGTVGYRQGEVSLPATPVTGWALIELNFTTAVTGAIFDTDYNVWVNNVMILFGTLPEYGTATVLKNVTEYQSILAGESHWAFRHPHDCTGPCSFTSSVELLFYPAREPVNYGLPDSVLPLWNYSAPVLRPGQETNTTLVTVPSDVTRAVLEVYPYGYGVDEFWYADEPSFRMVNLSVGGRGLAELLPFPYVNTGGIDLFAWRPLTADFTLNDRPQTLDVTPALGFLEGTHPWSATVNQSNLQGVSAGSYWHVAADLLLWTDPAVSGAKLTAYTWQNPVVSTFATPGCTDYVSPACWFNQSATAYFSYGSEILGTGYRGSSTLTDSLHFVNDQFITPVWENVTGEETTLVSSASASSANGQARALQVRVTESYPLALQTGSFLTLTGTDSYSCNGSPCPEGNIVSLMNGFSQTYNVSTDTAFYGPGGTSVDLGFVNETTVVPLSNFTGALQFVAPTGAILTGLLFNDAATTKIYKQVNEPTDPGHLYEHVVEGSDYVNNATEATLSNNNEAIGLDTVTTAPTAEFFLTALGNLALALDQANSRIASLTRSVASLQGQVANLTKALGASGSRSQQAQAELQDLVTQVGVLTGELSSAQLSLGAAEASLVSLQAQYNASQQQVNGLEQNLTTLRSTVMEDQGQIAALESELSQSRASAASLWAGMNRTAQAPPLLSGTALAPLLSGAAMGAAGAVGAIFLLSRSQRRRHPPTPPDPPRE